MWSYQQGSKHSLWFCDNQDYFWFCQLHMQVGPPLSLSRLHTYLYTQHQNAATENHTLDRDLPLLCGKVLNKFVGTLKLTLQSLAVICAIVYQDSFSLYMKWAIYIYIYINCCFNNTMTCNRHLLTNYFLLPLIWVY